MPNLDKVFNKFFPQSQTGSKGKFLLQMAWSVEILVAFIGLFIGIIIIRGSQGVTDASDLMSRGVSLNDLTIGMIFIIVAVVELTKIPLATAVYYSVRLSWKIIFLIGLLLVNVSTFETIVTGFERINRERTRDTDKLIVEYHSTKTKIENLSENTRVNDLDKDIDKLIKQRTDINNQINQIIIADQTLVQDIKESGSNQDAIKQLSDEINLLNANIKELRTINSKLPSQKKKVGFFGSNANEIDNRIEANTLTIQNYEKEKKSKEEERKALIGASSKNNKGRIDTIKEGTNAKIKPLNDQLKVIASKINKLENRQEKLNISEEEKDSQLTELDKRKQELITKIDEIAPDNQVFRVAIWLKGWFIIDYSDEINKINEQIFKLEKQKVKSITERGWFDKFFSIFNKNSSLDNEAIDRQIVNLQKKITEFEKKATKAVTNISESVYADLPQGAITAAFWLWFGVLSFIISVTGTMLAFASLVLLDPRLHIIRNKKTANWRGLATRISRFFVLTNKYIWGKIKRFRDPNIKIVEKEVEKIVEKEIIVEKNIGEKIVYEKVEIPKEVIRKEIVYVPLPTDDNELLKKGPFTAPEYDKKK
jgi:hypothetical protein